MSIPVSNENEQLLGRTDAVSPLTRAEINKRCADSIAATLNLPVIREDMLGEGQGAWDADPRYPTDSVNCMVWLQLIICEVYSQGLVNKIDVMDRIRYYGGHVAYGLRKHFIDHWLSIEPAPLVKVAIGDFVGRREGSVELDYEKFRSSHNYPCRLYREDKRRFEFDYIAAETLLDFIDLLPHGYYFVFAVASDRYLERFGQYSGPMGLVHSLIMNVADAQESNGSANQHRNQGTVYHAATALGRIVEIPLPQYIEKMTSLYHGYSLFELDPAWGYSSLVVLNEEAQRIKEHEAKLPRNRVNRLL